MSEQPWDHHEDLTRDRLQLVAKALRDARNDTLPLHDPAGGDTAWSLGCRVYARSAEALIRLADPHWLWLKIISPPLEFIFSIGDVPMRFYHGDANHPQGHNLKVAAAEQVQLDFAFGDAAADLLWRLAVESNAVGEAQDVILVGLTPAGAMGCRYEIPLDDSVSFLVPPRPSEKTPVRLQPPRVRPRHPPEERKDSDDDGKQPV